MRSSPALVPTRPSGDNSNAPASTAFVGTAVASVGSSVGIFTATTNGFVPASGGSSLEVLYADATFREPANNSAILQVLQDTYTANAALQVALPYDDTIPTITEGTEILSQAITLASTASKVLATVNVWGSLDNAVAQASQAVFRSSVCINAAQMGVLGDSGADTVQVAGPMTILDSPGSTAAITYSVRVGPSSSATSVYLNGAIGTRRFGGASTCTLTLMEVAG
jgi:hypothetical protein